MKTLQIPALDGFLLEASLFPALPCGDPRGVVVMAAATATPQGFYRGFAEHLAAQGWEVLTFDYRGIGKSRPRSLRGFQAGYLDWAEQDLAAVIDWAAPRGPVHLMGHSFGGQALGLLPRPELVRSLCTFGTGCGHHSYMPRAEQLKVLAIWQVLGPVASTLCGYLPGRALGLGEDLPVGVYRDWKRWCGFRHYWFDDPERSFHARFAAIRTPILALSAEDDRWAPRESVDAYMGFYSGAKVERVHLVPTDHGLGGIGHIGYFRRSAGTNLWPSATTWLDRQSASAHVTPG